MFPAPLTLIREFLGPSPSEISGKKIQSAETYINDATLRSGFFSAKRARWQSRVLDFFHDSRIRIKPRGDSMTLGKNFGLDFFEKCTNVCTRCSRLPTIYKKNENYFAEAFLDGKKSSKLSQIFIFRSIFENCWTCPSVSFTCKIFEFYNFFD